MRERWRPALTAKIDIGAAVERRLHLTYPVGGTLEGEEREVPFVIGVIGDFSCPLEGEAPPLTEVRFKTLTRHSTSAMMKTIKPTVDIEVDDLLNLSDADAAAEGDAGVRRTREGDTGEAPRRILSVRLTLQALADLSPDAVGLAVPTIRRQIVRRAAYAELRRRLRPAAPPPPSAAGTPPAELSEACLSARADIMAIAQRDGIPSTKWRDDVKRLASDLAGPATDLSPEAQRDLDIELAQAILELDYRLSNQVSAILHHPRFRSLEATWRGLSFLLRTLPPDRDIRVKLLDIPKDQLFEDLQAGRSDPPNIRESMLHQLMVEEEYAQFGGEPFALLVLDHPVSAMPADLGYLRRLAMIGEVSHTPVLVAATPDMIGLSDFTDLAHKALPVVDALERRDVSALWRRLRGEIDAAGRPNAARQGEPERFLCFVLPRLLGRAPITATPEEGSPFVFRERPPVEPNAPPDARAQAQAQAQAQRPWRSSDLLWINPAYGVAQLIVRSFHRYRWCTTFTGYADGAGILAGLPTMPFQTGERPIHDRYPLEVQLTEEQARDCTVAGLTPLMPIPGRGGVALHDALTIAAPRKPMRGPIPLAEIFRTKLTMVLAVCRIAHYLKVMMREMTGQNRSARDLESELNRWLSQYTVRQDDVTPELQAERPLRDARVIVSETPNRPGEYQIAMTLAPHTSVQGIACTLELASEMLASTGG